MTNKIYLMFDFGESQKSNSKLNYYFFLPKKKINQPSTRISDQDKSELLNDTFVTLYTTVVHCFGEDNGTKAHKFYIIA